MTTTLEKVARAICREVQLQDFGHRTDDGFKTTVPKIEALDASCEKAARAAIEALMFDKPATLHEVWHNNYLQAILDEESETV